MPDNKNEKTREERIAELDQEKKNAWENFRQLDYDKMDAEERLSIARHLYETMATTLGPEEIGVNYDFWKQFDNTDAIKDIRSFMAHVDDTLANLPKNPTKNSWLDREHGIVANMKREWKAKIEPFKDERRLREQIRDMAQEIFSLPENQGKELSVDMSAEVKKAVENIEETAYKPTREKIGKIEEEVKKRVN